MRSPDTKAIYTTSYSISLTLGVKDLNVYKSYICTIMLWYTAKTGGLFLTQLPKYISVAAGSEIL